MSTVFACLVVALFLAIAAVGIRVGGAVLARQQAETAADLGALAGAARILEGQVAACAAAGAVVAANHGTMTSCSVDQLDLLVVANVSAPALGGSASGRARAGPVTVI